MKKFYLFAVALLLVTFSCTQKRYIQVSGFAQGGRYSVKLSTGGLDLSPEAVRDSIDAILFHIDTTLSGYNKNSQLSRFNAGETIVPNTLFLEMYSLAYSLWEESGGALDFAAGALYDAWGWGFKNSEFPSSAAVKEILSSCGMKHLPRKLCAPGESLDPGSLGYPVLNYNAIAQGYSCDLVAAFLRRHEVKDMLVDIGEIRCLGLGPSGEPWAVGVDRPVDRAPGDGSAEIDAVWTSAGKDFGIVTSGNYRKFYIRDGKKYAHTVDPVSGYPVSHNLLSATLVCGESAAMADALATWCMVIGPEKARELILSRPSCEGYLITSSEDGGMKEWASPGFTLREKK